MNVVITIELMLCLRESFACEVALCQFRHMGLSDAKVTHVQYLTE